MNNLPGIISAPVVEDIPVRLSYVLCFVLFHAGGVLPRAAQVFAGTTRCNANERPQTGTA